MISGSREGRPLVADVVPALWSRSVKGFSVLGQALPGKMLEQGREGIDLLSMMHFGAGQLKTFFFIFPISLFTSQMMLFIFNFICL